ncbi:general substrate transporter [Aspergillus heterothallicus]
MVIIGIVLSNFTNYGFVYGSNGLDGAEAQWRIPIALQMLFPVFVLIALPFCVESPRWLAAKGLYDKCFETLAKLEGNGATANSDHIQALGNSIISVAKHEASIESSWKAALMDGELQNLRRLVLSGAAGFMHQATGINVVVYYAPIIFQDIGLDSELSYIMSCVASIFFLIGSILPVFYIERMGRRRVMMMGACLCGSCMGVIACCVGVGENFPSLKISAGWAATAFVFLFEFSFGVGWNSMCWLYGSEINSLRMRNKGAAVQCSCNWATNFLTVMVTPIGFATLSWKFYFVWMGVTLASLPWLYLCYPETTGRSLEQMDFFFAKYRSWNVKKVAHEWVRDPGVSSAGTDDVKEVSTEVEFV